MWFFWTYSAGAPVPGRGRTDNERSRAITIPACSLMSVRRGGARDTCRRMAAHPSKRRGLRGPHFCSTLSELVRA